MAMALVDSRAPMTDELGLREELSRMQVMLLQYAHLVLELRQQLPSGHERPEQIPPKLDALPKKAAALRQLAALVGHPPGEGAATLLARRTVRLDDAFLNDSWFRY